MSTATKHRHIPIRSDWLALRTEEAIEPERPIVDAHHHLWDKPGNRYFPETLRADFGGHDVVATVFVEGKDFYRTEGDPAEQSLGETEAVAALAAADGGGIAAAIVGYVDLALGRGAGELLERHISAAGGRFRGVRNTSAWHADPEARGSVVLPPPGLLYDPGFRAGLEELAACGLVFDAWMYHTQLGELRDLAADMRGVTIVLNHMGGPIGIGPYAGRRAEVVADWDHFMGRLSEIAEVRVKLGGFGMLMSGFDFHERALPPSSDELCDAWGPYIRSCIARFGADRCMFESNFPVDKGTASYTVVWNAFKKSAMHLSSQERDALFFGTANRTYSLGLPLPSLDAGGYVRSA